jgi:hypothetical protein
MESLMLNVIYPKKTDFKHHQNRKLTYLVPKISKIKKNAWCDYYSQIIKILWDWGSPKKNKFWAQFMQFVCLPFRESERRKISSLLGPAQWRVGDNNLLFIEATRKSDWKILTENKLAAQPPFRLNLKFWICYDF